MESHHHKKETITQDLVHASALDPICGMDVHITPESLHHEHNGKTYYFCSEHCLVKFKEDPENFIKPAKDTSDERSALESQEVKDPVCGMSTDDPDTYQQYEFNGQKYYFCSDHCLAKFKNNPNEFISREQPEHTEEEHGEGMKYTCPMDPEIVQDHPGSCPKCGMALEPMTSSLPDTRTEYTCPMHPEIVKDEPGNCPKCGMALEPRTVEVA
jgi:Cu+-exporting ATPase